MNSGMGEYCCRSKGMMTTLLPLLLAISVFVGEVSCAAVVVPAMNSTTCSRDLSRRVRSFLHDDIFSAMSVSAVDLPISCPFHPQRDIFGDHEKHKYEVHRGEWRVSTSYIHVHTCTYVHYMSYINVLYLIGTYSAHIATRDLSMSST